MASQWGNRVSSGGRIAADARGTQLKGGASLFQMPFGWGLGGVFAGAFFFLSLKDLRAAVGVWVRWR